MRSSDGIGGFLASHLIAGEVKRDYLSTPPSSQAGSAIVLEIEFRRCRHLSFIRFMENTMRVRRKAREHVSNSKHRDQPS